jgi:ferredoxin
MERRVEKGDLPSPGFEPGNKKTGQSGGNFNNVIVWNIPPAATCPGASEWCLSVCYNGDDRPEVFQKDKWQSNLLAFNTEPSALFDQLQQEVGALEPPLAIRIHSSGDFFSEEYINFWTAMADSLPEVTFWAYTRSWAIPELREPLEELRARNNIQLFASWDNTMAEPPEGWRLSYVEDGEVPETVPSNLTRCPEEFIEGMNCARCGFCLRNIGRGVLFHAH